jgi:hypothetical protein
VLTRSGQSKVVNPTGPPAAPLAAAPALPSGSILKLFGIDLNKLAAPQVVFSARLPMIIQR